MPIAVVFAIALVLALLCAQAPVKWAATLLVGVIFLVPDAVPVPYGPHSLTIYRLVVWASSIGLLLRISRREIPGRCLRPTRAHLALAIFVIYAYFVGVQGADPLTLFSPNYHLWLSDVDQLLLLMCLVAYARLLGVRWLATRAVIMVAISAGIGCIERLDGNSYARYWFE